MRKLLISITILALVGLSISGCGSSRKSCNTKGKTKVDMGWM